MKSNIRVDVAKETFFDLLNSNPKDADYNVLKDQLEAWLDCKDIITEEEYEWIMENWDELLVEYDNRPLYPDEITGVIGQWVEERDLSHLSENTVKCLNELYTAACLELEGGKK